MAMSRRDFLTIADAIKAQIAEAADAGDGGTLLAMDALARDLADRFGNGSLAFDRDHFLERCGITPQP